MKRNNNQINDLFAFTKQHFVDYYDIQIELVDHLANDIEAIWKENPTISYEKAKQKAFDKFGVFGFQEIIEAKQKAAQKRYFNIFWKSFISFFKIPKIVLITSAILGYYYVLNHSNFSQEIITWSLIIIFLTGFVFAIKYELKIRKKQRETGKKWLLETMSRSLLLFFVSFQIIINLLRVIQKQTNLWESHIFITSNLIVLFAVSIYIITVEIPKKTREMLAKKYPNYVSFN